MQLPLSLRDHTCRGRLFCSYCVIFFPRYLGLCVHFIVLFLCPIAEEEEEQEPVLAEVLDEEEAEDTDGMLVAADGADRVFRFVSQTVRVMFRPHRSSRC